MRDAAKNAMRSGLVVIGAVAFGYLSLQIGFKPYFKKHSPWCTSLHSNRTHLLLRRANLTTPMLIPRSSSAKTRVSRPGAIHELRQSRESGSSKHVIIEKLSSLKPYVRLKKLRTFSVTTLLNEREADESYRKRKRKR
ncbi:hypothetical protein RJ639_009934 [Escallonia herrerae]|uniref:Uncharacterized protein n=1 Tax=Escallonia herrerae TaxID=1293975 RepID=A0AA89AVZ4_9ASTE|nr:hypothetical protein RJ639_009934 [Escallonia herrerae]